MKKFVTLDKYGQLYIDKVLFETYFPIIFTCINDDKEIFLCVCCQNNKKGIKWLVGKTNGMNIVKMLRDEITIRRLLLDYSSEKITVDYTENEYKVFYNNTDWKEDSLYLPKDDSYMYAEDGEFEDEIKYFSMIGLYYDENHYECIVERCEVIDKDIPILTETITDALDKFASVMGNIKISREVVDTLVMIGEICVEITKKYTSSLEYDKQGEYEDVLDYHSSKPIEGINIEIDVEDSYYVDAA